MFKLFAGAFASIGMLFGSLFGGHHGTPPNGQMGSSTGMEMGGHGMGSSTPWKNGTSTDMMGGHMMPGVFGVVASISGTSLTVTGKGGMDMNTASTTYTVDASAASVRIKDATSTVSDIKVGDHVVVVGTVSGTSITAKMILDGIMPPPMHMGGPGDNGKGGWPHGTSTPPQQPKGQW